MLLFIKWSWLEKWKCCLQEHNNIKVRKIDNTDLNFSIGIEIILKLRYSERRRDDRKINQITCFNFCRNGMNVCRTWGPWSGSGELNKSNSLVNNVFLYNQNLSGGMLLWRNSYILMVWIKWEQSWRAHDWLYSLNKDIEFKEATKSYFTHCSCVVIVLFNTISVGLHFWQFIVEHY